jgi:hypothetical protein
MLEKRYYNLDSLISNQNFINSLDFVFIGNSNEQRSLKVNSLISGLLKIKKFSINYDIEFEKYSIEQFEGAFNLAPNKIGVIF